MVSDRSNGIYRGVIAAIVGLSLVGADKPPNPPTQTEQSNTAQPEQKSNPIALPNAAKATQPIKRPKRTEPCGQTRYESNDDLCAQWKAADAAAEAAQWAWWQIILSALGVAGLGFTLWFNFRALRLAERESEETKGALKIAAVNADAAQRLAINAERASERELRAYITVDFARMDGVQIGKKPSAVLGLKNSGRTPALKYCREAKILIMPKVFKFPLNLGSVSDEGMRDVGAGNEFEVKCIAEKALSIRDMKKLVSKKYILCFFVLIKYEDVLEKDRTTSFAAYANEPGESNTLGPCAIGNEST